MKKKTFDFIIIIAIALILTILNQFELLEASAKFAFVPLLALYYMGKWSEKKF